MIVRAIEGGCILSVRVHPCAKRNSISGTLGDELKISLTTPPADGRSNVALTALVAERLRLPRLSVEIISGATSRSKKLRLTGITAAEAEKRLHSEEA